jgi:hypothetical protein
MNHPFFQQRSNHSRLLPCDPRLQLWAAAIPHSTIQHGICFHQFLSTASSPASRQHYTRLPGNLTMNEPLSKTRRLVERPTWNS